MIYTVFFKDGNEPPQDFETYTEAKEYAEEQIEYGYATAYEMETTGGEIV